MASLVSKAIQNVSQFIAKASRNSLSSFVVNAPHQYGQPYSASAGIGDAMGYVSPFRMREIVLKTPTAGMCVNSILDYSSNVEIIVQNVDPSIPADPEEVAYVESLLNDPSEDETGLSFKQKIFRDLLTLGYAATEIEDNTTGGVYALHAVDGAKLQADFDEHGKTLGYNMIDAHGQPIAGPDGVHAWLPDEIIWYQRNAQTSSKYPISQISQLYVPAVIEDLILYFVSGKFTDSNVPFGIYDLGDITDTELRKAIDSWNTQVESQHRIMLVNTKNGGKFVPFGYHLKDLEADKLIGVIQQMIRGIMGVTMNEAGESQDVNKSNGYFLSYTFKKRAVEPLLNEFCTTTTKFLLHRRLGLTHLKLGYREIDSRDDLLRAQVDDLELKHGAITVNEMRNRQGKTNMAGGDEAFLFTGTAYLPLSMVNKMAEAQLRAVLAEAQMLELQVMLALAGDQSAAGDGSSGVSPPMIRPPKAMEGFSTPDGAGSSSFKFKLPKPQIGPPGQAERGPVQALQNAGVRKDQ